MDTTFVAVEDYSTNLYLRWTYTIHSVLTVILNTNLDLVDYFLLPFEK